MKKKLWLTAALATISGLAVYVKKRRTVSDTVMVDFLMKLAHAVEGDEGDYLVFQGLYAWQIKDKRKYTVLLKEAFTSDGHQEEKLFHELAAAHPRFVRFGSRRAEEIASIILGEDTARPGL